MKMSTEVGTIFLQTIKNKFLTPSLDENVNSNVNVQSRITLAKPGAPKLKLGKMSQFVRNLGTFCYKQYKVKGEKKCFSINYTTIKDKLLTPSSDENVNGNWNNFFTNNKKTCF